MHILHTVLYTFSLLLRRRICWSLPWFSWPSWLIQEWYCSEKLDTGHSKESKNKLLSWIALCPPVIPWPTVQCIFHEPYNRFSLLVFYLSVAWHILCHLCMKMSIPPPHPLISEPGNSWHFLRFNLKFSVVVQDIFTYILYEGNQTTVCDITTLLCTQIRFMLLNRCTWFVLNN